MEPEKFDKVLLDVLYDETDDVTRAAAERHMGQSERARRVFDDLRAAREVGRIELVDPPDDLYSRIMDAERSARAERSLGARIGGMVSLVASYAMRPQLGMAALLLLMLGSSLLLLRARPGAHDSVLVTERGVPEAENESVSIRVDEPPNAADTTPAARERSRSAEQAVASDEPRPTSPTAPKATKAARAPADSEDLAFPAVTEEASAANARAAAEKELGESSPFDDAMLAYREGRYAEARRRFDEVSGSGDPNAATAELFAARAAQRTGGCAAAVDRFDKVARKHPGEAIAYEAQWQSAECRRQMGEADRADRTYRALLNVPSYAAKAQRALASMSRAVARVDDEAASAAPAAKPAAAKASKPESADEAP